MRKANRSCFPIRDSLKEFFWWRERFLAGKNKRFSSINAKFSLIRNTFFIFNTFQYFLIVCSQHLITFFIIYPFVCLFLSRKPRLFFLFSGQDNFANGLNLKQKTGRNSPPRKGKKPGETPPQEKAKNRAKLSLRKRDLRFELTRETP